MTRRICQLSLVVLTLSCASSSPVLQEDPPPPLSPAAVICADPSLAADDFCMPIDRIETLMRTPEPTVFQTQTSMKGFSLPNALTLGVPDPDSREEIVFKVKWKVAPEGGDGFNNSPRREVGAYALQALFLEPDEYVVPPSLIRCFDEDWHEEHIGDRDETFDDSDCVFGLMAYWMQNVTGTDALDVGRAKRDPAYREHLAALNILTVLIDHRDSRPANFLMSTDPERPRVFAIDNGIAFAGYIAPFQWLVGDWGDMHVPKLLHRHVNALRVITREDLDALAVVAQFEARDDLYIPAEPTAPLDPDKGVRREGTILQFGLRKDEIDGIERQLRKILEQVDDGDLLLF